MDFVLDASVTLAWAFEDEASPYADLVIGSLVRVTAAVPPIWPIEITNAILSAHRRGRIDRVGAIRLMNSLEHLPVEIVSLPPLRKLEPGIFELGHTYRLSAYDANYLEMALQRRLPLATIDARLADAAERTGIELVRP